MLQPAVVIKLVPVCSLKNSQQCLHTAKCYPIIFNRRARVFLLMVNSGDLQYRHTHFAYLAFEDLVVGSPKDFPVFKEDDPWYL